MTRDEQIKKAERLRKITWLEREVKSGRRRRTVFTDLTIYGHDEDFQPIAAQWSTEALCGSAAKVEVLRLRVERGEDLWCSGDNREIQPHCQSPPKDNAFLIRIFADPHGGRKSLET